MNELRRLMAEYKEANTCFYDCLKMGDTRWELYQKQMKVIWAKIKIELDDICPLTMDDIQTIAEYSREQDSQYLGDTINLYAKFRGDVE